MNVAIYLVGRLHISLRGRPRLLGNHFQAQTLTDEVTNRVGIEQIAVLGAVE